MCDRILIAVDGSDEAERAAKRGLEFAHVRRWPSTSSTSSSGSRFDSREPPPKSDASGAR